MRIQKCLPLFVGILIALFLVQTVGAMLPCAGQLWPRFFYSGFENGFTGGFVPYPPDAWGPGNSNRSYEVQDMGIDNWCLSWVENGFFWTNHILQASVQYRGGVSNNVGLIYHLQNPNNYYLFVLSEGNTASLMVCVNGTIVRAESTTYDYQPDNWYVLRVEVQGSEHTARVNGVPVLTWTDSTFMYGTGGLVARGSNAWFDNVISILRPSLP